MKTQKPSLFLDRDGVINTKLENDYVKTWAEFKFIDNSIEAISILSNHFENIFVVTNQQGIGKGLMSELDLRNIHQNMLSKLLEANVCIKGVYFCPHLVQNNCSCRKPKTGMFEQAKNEFNGIDFRTSWMIGDSSSDIIAGNNAGMNTVLIGKLKPKLRVNYTFSSLYEYAKELEHGSLIMDKV